MNKTILQYVGALSVIMAIVAGIALYIISVLNVPVVYKNDRTKEVVWVVGPKGDLLPPVLPKGRYDMEWTTKYPGAKWNGGR